MKVGSLVECIKGKTGQVIANGEKVFLIQPIIGEIYTIREIRESPFEKGVIGILLEEIQNPVCSFAYVTMEPGYNIERFREIQPPMKIDIETLIHENTLQP